MAVEPHGERVGVARAVAGRAAARVERLVARVLAGNYLVASLRRRRLAGRDEPA
jgi:hypothetical protein